MVKKVTFTMFLLISLMIVASLAQAGFLADFFSGSPTGMAVVGADGWTGWLDRDNPSGVGDYEDINSFGPENICYGESPIKVDCRRKSDLISWNQTGQVVHNTLANGCWCKNEEQVGYGNLSYTICDDYEVRFLCEEEIINETNVSNNLGQKVPKISFWQGKVNQHYDEATDMWVTDSDGVSGAELCATDILRVNYCKKFYPNTESVIQLDDELIAGWRDRGNVAYYTSTKPVYECLEEPSIACDPLNPENYNDSAVLLFDGESYGVGNYDVTLNRVGASSIIVGVNGQLKVVGLGGFAIFDQADDFRVDLVDLSFVEGCDENQAALILTPGDLNSNCLFFANDGPVYSDSPLMPGDTYEVSFELGSNCSESFLADIYFDVPDIDLNEQIINTFIEPGIVDYNLSLEIPNDVQPGTYGSFLEVNPFQNQEYFELTNYNEFEIFSNTTTNCTSLNLINYEDGYIISEGNTMNFANHAITIEDIGLSSAFVNVDGQTKVIMIGETEIFDQANNFEVTLLDVAYVEGCPENELALSFNASSEEAMLSLNKIYFNPKELYPGDSLGVHFSVYNTYSFDVPAQVTVRIDPLQVYFTEDVVVEQELVFNLDLDIPEDASPGSYNVLTTVEPDNSNLEGDIDDFFIDVLEIVNSTNCSIPLNPNSYGNNVQIFFEGDTLQDGNYSVTLDRVGASSAIVYVNDQMKIISKGQYKYFDEYDDYKIEVVDIAYVEGCLTNQAALILFGPDNIKDTGSNGNNGNSVGNNNDGINENVPVCGGCSYNGKCYDVGIRKDARYCATDGYMYNYKDAKDVCENNFECASNVCINGDCMKPSMFKKFQNWLDWLF